MWPAEQPDKSRVFTERSCWINIIILIKHPCGPKQIITKLSIETKRVGAIENSEPFFKEMQDKGYTTNGRIFALLWVIKNLFFIY